MSAPQSFKKRKSLREHFRWLDSLPEDKRERRIAEDMEELERDDQACEAYADLICHFCREDEDDPTKDKVRKFSSTADLDQHWKDFHTPILEWQRWASQHRVDMEGDYECPYCVGAGINERPYFETMRQLEEHVQSSNAETMGSKHDELKAAAGWYDESFQKSLNVGRGRTLSKTT